MSFISSVELDLDGVLVDFDEKFKSIIGVYPEFANREHHYKNFSRFVHARGFAEAGVVENAKEFFNGMVKLSYKYSFDLRFLTSDGSIREFRDPVMSQKIEWLKTNGMWLGDSKFILSHGWRGKCDYSHSGSILIDDTERNLKHFENNGQGVGILYSPSKYKEILKAIEEVCETNV